MFRVVWVHRKNSIWAKSINSKNKKIHFKNELFENNLWKMRGLSSDVKILDDFFA